MGFEASPLLPALMAAALWAVSAPIVSIGLRAMPEDRFLAIAAGLAVSLFAGSFSLFVLSGFRVSAAMFSPVVVMAGVLTFPLGTGLYYLCGHVARARLEIAAQYANVKPAATILLAHLLLGETVSGRDTVSVILIGLGVLILVSSAARKDFSLRSIGVGLALAAVWSGGELLARIATADLPAMDVTLGALWASALLYFAGLAIYLVAARRLARFREQLVSPPMAVFALHGVLSFGLAYLFYFQSIAARGLIATILITTFWPALALVLGIALAKARRETYPISPASLFAFAAFTLGSALYVFARV